MGSGSSHPSTTPTQLWGRQRVISPLRLQAPYVSSEDAKNTCFLALFTRLDFTELLRTVPDPCTHPENYK